MLSHTRGSTTRSKSPMHVGLRGLTPPMPPASTSTDPLKSPQHWGDVGGPHPIPITRVPAAEKPSLALKKESEKLNIKPKFPNPRPYT